MRQQRSTPAQPPEPLPTVEELSQMAVDELGLDTPDLVCKHLWRVIERDHGYTERRRSRGWTPTDYLLREDMVAIARAIILLRGEK